MSLQTSKYFTIFLQFIRMQTNPRDTKLWNVQHTMTFLSHPGFSFYTRSELKICDTFITKYLEFPTYVCENMSWKAVRC
jgi:hypothetical protein